MKQNTGTFISTKEKRGKPNLQLGLEITLNFPTKFHVDSIDLIYVRNEAILCLTYWYFIF